MRASLVALLLLSIAGCDLVSDDGPAWTEVGAVATFDYTPGPDSLSVLGPGRTPPFRRAPATPRAVEMHVVADGGPGTSTGRRVAWRDPGADSPLSRFAEAGLPLSDARVDVSSEGLTVTVPHDCPDLGLWRVRSTAEAGPVTFVRVPREAAGALDVWGDCTQSPLHYRAVRVETVTVPAGTFEAVVIEGPAHPDGTGALGVEWWSWEAGLVRYDALRYDGVLQGRFVRSARP
ncbi:hypothetical protein [Rubrivirga marina]|uniref:Lipoprotein n=1 Tax=Rubrivirga marina TaxID=1196024 RepID=A0A271J1C8_9BACT|nr:hypothetical protein [Rubrivirga marina]PAP76529.1 hypothetical protein BSZ37_08785 [Rubrivirga marina]